MWMIFVKLKKKEKLRNMLSKDEKESRQRTASTTSSAQSDEYGMPTALEPRLTFSIDPQLPPREKKEFEKAGTVKISSSPGMPTVSTVGVQIFHRAMRIHVSIFYNIVFLFLF